ncbi:MAG: hypothetical protein HY717_11645 [Planctomycetes bacterium]|nr:hypothetical protein [Planctomycetota bacterium]
MSSAPIESNPPAAPRAGPEDSFRELEAALSAGAAACEVDQAFERLFGLIERGKQYPQLFEAMIMRCRWRLGLPLIQIGTAADLPESLLEAMEDGIEEACRRVGRLFLADGDPVKAWPYLRAVGDLAAMAAALEEIEPGTRRKDVESLVEIAIHENVLPRRGFEMAVQHFGICNAITRFEQAQPALARKDQEASARVLVRSLHKDLVENLRREVEQREGGPHQAAGLLELIEPRPQLFHGDAYYIDTSHLHAVLRFSAFIPDGKELEQAIELTEYGRRLSKVYRFQTEPPFEDYYHDQGIFLRGVQAARDPARDPAAIDRAAKHFGDKARRALEQKTADYPMPAVLEVLARLGRLTEAIDLALAFESMPGAARCRAPNVYELCQLAGDFNRLAQIARERSDLVAFAAGLVQKNLKKILCNDQRESAAG